MIETALPRDAAVLASLRVPARPGSLRLVRRLVREAALAVGADGDWADDMVLAVDEACQNVVRHAYGDTAAGDMVVTLRRCDSDDAPAPTLGGLQVDILDYAPTVDPATVRGRDLDDLRPGGLGVHLIGAVCEEAGFVPPPPGAGNLFRLVKRFAKNPVRR